MRDDSHYLAGTVRAVLDTDLVTAQTAAALRRRLEPSDAHFHVLGADGLRLLVAICDRLIPQSDRESPIDLAQRLHRNIAIGDGDGWRYATLPGDRAALIVGVAAVDASARTMTGMSFLGLDDDGRDTVLAAVQRGDAPRKEWEPIVQKRWFEELLVAVAELYFAHPIAQEEIGYLGMADAQGWAEVGLGARAAFEPVELHSND